MPSHPQTPSQLTVHTVIAHGTDCGADGVISYADGRRQAFSHVVIFAGHAETAKIRAIRTYLVDDTPVA